MSLQALEEARRRTLGAGSARFALRTTWTFPPLPRRRRGGLARPLLRAGKLAGGALLRSALGDRDPRDLRGEGVLDLTGRRFALDYGSYARLHAGGTTWGGRSGRPIATLPPDEHDLPAPLWLLDVLAGATAATDAGRERVGDADCRGLAVTVDLARASAATPGGVATPPSPRFEDLLAFPVEVWFDDAQVRRVRARVEHRTHALELWDLGVALDAVDWSRLPGGAE